MEYDYDKIRKIILYSDIMKNLYRKESPIYGFGSAGGYASYLERHVRTVAILNGMDPDYCSVLALTGLLGLPPYGREGAAAIKELFGNHYDETAVNINRFESLTGFTCEPKLKKDLTALSEYTENDEDQLSNEARCVLYAAEAFRDYHLLSLDEREKLGGIILQNAMLNGIKKDEYGKLQRSVWQKKIFTAVSDREKPVDKERVEAVKKKMQLKMVSAGSDEQAVIENIIGD